MFQYDFIRNAFLAGLALSVVSGLVGYFIVLRRQTFAGEALSDVAFTGAVAGAILGINPLAGMVVLTIMGALAIGSFSIHIAERDVAVGIVLAWVLGLGVLFLSLFSISGGTSGFSGVTILFGSILSISSSETIIIGAVAAAILLAMVIIARPLFFISLDPEVATAKGIPTRLISVGFMIL